MLGAVGTTASPASASANAAGSRILDGAPPMPAKQKRGSNPLFTPPMEDGQGMGDVGADPLIQTMSAAKAVDMAFQKLVMLFPEAVDPLAQMQMQFRQLITGLMSMQSAPQMGMGAPPIMPPLPMQSGPVPGMQEGIQI